jgi:hypothetical protein
MGTTCSPNLETLWVGELEGKRSRCRRVSTTEMDPRERQDGVV